MKQAAKGGKVQIYRFSARLIIISINDKYMNRQIGKSYDNVKYQFLVLPLQNTFARRLCLRTLTTALKRTLSKAKCSTCSTLASGHKRAFDNIG